MRHLRAVVTACVCVALVGCAGPTVRDSAVRSQAEKSAGSMVSELRTAGLVAEVQIKDNAWWRYADVVVTDAEKAATTIEGTFTSSQPPSREIEPLYRNTSTMLSDAADLVTDLRIAIRRHDTAEINRLRPQLAAAADDLEILEASLQ